MQFYLFINRQNEIRQDNKQRIIIAYDVVEGYKIYRTDKTYAVYAFDTQLFPCECNAILKFAAGENHPENVSLTKEQVQEVLQSLE